MADELKALGNAAFSAGNHEEAIKFFSQAIDQAPTNHVLYSNRSAAYASLNKYDEALTDGQKAVELKADWPKGYSRVAAAHYGLKQWDEAIQAYEDGLKLDPNNAQMQQGLADVQRAQRAEAGGGIFGGPAFLGKLAADPETRAYLSQPDFMAMMSNLQRNPQSMGMYMNDPRFSKALEVGLGLRMAKPDEFMGDAAGPAPPTANGGAAAEPAPEPMQTEAEPEPEPELSEGERAAAAAKAEATAEKEKGNAAYKERRFEEALQHYGRALELAFDVSFLTNRAAVYYEMGDYEKCVADCDEAVERGREVRADYKLIGRALTRKGNALAKSGALEEAVGVYHKALTEHRNAETLKRLQETEKALKEQREAAYMDLDLSNKEKEAGNSAFKEGKFPEAVQHYSEALKRGPPAINAEAYKLFSNRAACYTKLAAMNEALRDAEECIKLKPDFAKGYSRKGAVQFLMKEHDKALETYQAGLEHEPDNAELREGVQRCLQAIAKFQRGEVSEEDLKARQERAMADPEIQNILRDPVMSQVLRDLQENPTTSQAHLTNPGIRAKLNKLMAAGIVRMG